jgi:hypothetical protein
VRLKKSGTTSFPDADVLVEDSKASQALEATRQRKRESHDSVPVRRGPENRIQGENCAVKTLSFLTCNLGLKMLPIQVSP